MLGNFSFSKQIPNRRPNPFRRRKAPVFIFIVVEQKLNFLRVFFSRLLYNSAPRRELFRLFSTVSSHKQLYIMIRITFSITASQNNYINLYTYCRELLTSYGFPICLPVTLIKTYNCCYLTRIIDFTSQKRVTPSSPVMETSGEFEPEKNSQNASSLIIYTRISGIEFI